MSARANGPDRIEAYLEAETLNLDRIFLGNIHLVVVLGTLQRRLPPLLLLHLASRVELLVAQGVGLCLELNLLLFEGGEDAAAASGKQWFLILQAGDDMSFLNFIGAPLGLLGLGRFRILGGVVF